eukprot:4576135-Prymnesium_polylepis.1
MYSRLIHTVDHVEGYLREGYDAMDACSAAANRSRTRAAAARRRRLARVSRVSAHFGPVLCAVAV